MLLLSAIFAISKIFFVPENIIAQKYFTYAILLFSFSTCAMLFSLFLIKLVVQLLHTQCTCSIGKSTDYSRNTYYYCSHRHTRYIVIVLLWFPSSASATVLVCTVDFTCVRTLRVACVRQRVYIDQNSWLRTVMESKATPSRTIPWGSVKLHA